MLVIRELIKKNLVTDEQVKEAQEKRRIINKPVHDLLIEMGFISDQDLFDIARQFYSCSIAELDQEDLDLQSVQLIPREKAIRYGIFPLQKQGPALVVAMSNPCDLALIEEVSFITNLEIKAVLCRRDQIAHCINQYYQAQNTVHEILEDVIDDTPIEVVSKEVLSSEEIADMAQSSNDNPSLIRLVNKIVYDAVEARASDVHIEPREKVVEVRYRIDGHLKSIVRIPRDLHPRLSARIKLMARLDIAEHRKVQEGRIKVDINGRKTDLRISVVPIFYGEKLVLRILDCARSKFELDDLGFEENELEVIKEVIRRPQGVVLVTGPTGSGKTTTLYAALQEIKCETKNIVTIEDPIEYLIEGINQLQLSRFKDVTFANALKSILRQDPDVILVGEIRDRETADVAFRASMTGHTVFSTLHTNNSASSITRLLDIGLEPYLVASANLLLVAQRLVRVICQHCCEQYVPDEKLLLKFKSYLSAVDIRRFYMGKGCAHCGFTGFYGRTSIFEILKVDEKIRALIHDRSPEHIIFQQAIRNGMSTLVESGVRKVASGITTLSEIEKVVNVLSQREENSDAMV